MRGEQGRDGRLGGRGASPDDKLVSGRPILTEDHQLYSSVCCLEWHLRESTIICVHAADTSS